MADEAADDGAPAPLRHRLHRVRDVREVVPDAALLDRRLEGRLTHPQEFVRFPGNLAHRKRVRRVGDDNWAVYSQDGSLAAHFEFTVAVTEDGPRVLTPWHEA